MDANEISQAAVDTAWKMIQSLFRRHSFSTSDQNLLLNLLLLLSLEDLLGTKALRWRTGPPTRIAVQFEGSTIGLRRSNNRTPLKRRYRWEEIEAALDRCEQILDRYGLDDVEKATLFTALPCLGLHAIRSYVEWQEEPPFPEVTP